MQKILQELSDWGLNTFLSVLFTLVIIGLFLPFTYIGFTIGKAIKYRIKKYQGYDIKKYEKRAIFGLIILVIAEIIFYIFMSNLIFTGITMLMSTLIILGLFGIKITFDFEELLFSWVDDIFEKK